MAGDVRFWCGEWQKSGNCDWIRPDLTDPIQKRLTWSTTMPSVSEITVWFDDGQERGWRYELVVDGEAVSGRLPLNRVSTHLATIRHHVEEATGEPTPSVGWAELRNGFLGWRWATPTEVRS